MADEVELDDDEILMLMSGQTRVGTDRTEPRISATWFKLPTFLTERCQNKKCVDTRDKKDRGRKVTVVVKGQHMCRYCFLSGWLSDA